jgi:uncharacterized protein with von Willebrand factor type A (vWA) domain
VSYDVNLKGALTPEDIDERLDKAQEKYRKEARESKSESERRRLYKKAKGIEILQDRDFAEATVKEALNNRFGIVNLTLNFGLKKAEEMKLAMERARLRKQGVRSVRVRRRHKRRRRFK